MMLTAGVKKGMKATGGGPKLEEDVCGSQQTIHGVTGVVAVNGVEGGFDSALSETVYFSHIH